MRAAREKRLQPGRGNVRRAHAQAPQAERAGARGVREAGGAVRGGVQRGARGGVGAGRSWVFWGSRLTALPEEGTQAVVDATKKVGQNKADNFKS